MIISELVNGSGLILGCLAWDMMKIFVSGEVHFYEHFENFFFCVKTLGTLK